MKELKARCTGFATVEQKLRKMEANLVGETNEIANYFETEGRGALRITQGEKGSSIGLAAYNAETGCFDIISTPIAEVTSARRLFSKLFSNIAQIKFEKKVQYFVVMSL